MNPDRCTTPVGDGYASRFGSFEVEKIDCPVVAEEFNIAAETIREVRSASEAKDLVTFRANGRAQSKTFGNLNDAMAFARDRSDSEVWPRGTDRILVV